MLTFFRLVSVISKISSFSLYFCSSRSIYFRIKLLKFHITFFRLYFSFTCLCSPYLFSCHISYRFLLIESTSWLLIFSLWALVFIFALLFPSCNSDLEFYHFISKSILPPVIIFLWLLFLVLYLSLSLNAICRSFWYISRSSSTSSLLIKIFTRTSFFLVSFFFLH